VPLDRDVIFLVEAGEEGSTGVGIGDVVQQHDPVIDAEYCFAEGGNVTRVGGQVKFAAIQAQEKVSSGIELTAVGPSGPGAAPLAGMVIVELSKAVAALGSWRVPFLFNDTRREFFRLMGTVSSPAAARDSFQKNEPRYASMLHTSISPTIITGGYRSNVIPSEAKATLDVRMMPDEDPAAFLAAVQHVINNSAATARYTSNTSRPVPPPARQPTSRMPPRGLRPTATRSGSSKPRSTASCASRTRSSTTSHASTDRYRTSTASKR